VMPDRRGTPRLGTAAKGGILRVDSNAALP
jgi:hypothetical protein